MLVRYQGYEPLVRFNEDWTGLVNNVAEHWEVNAEATEYTFTLRKGHKWSDGQPFTTADVQFWYDAYFTDEEANLGGNTWWYSDGEPAKLEVIDEQTFKVEFATPNGFFVQQLAWAQQDQLVRTPKHYLEQFHIRYNPDADALAKADGARELDRQLFQQRDRLHRQRRSTSAIRTGPTLMAWIFDVEGCVAPGRAPSRRSRCATRTTSRSTPRARSSPTSTASSTRWSPIPRCCCSRPCRARST